MIVKKTFKYRIYPTPAQEKMLYGWDRTLRRLWNLAHEQRLMGIWRTDPVYPSHMSQNKEVTLLLPDDPWLARIPCCVRQEVPRILDTAWERFFKKLAKRPRFKKRTNSIKFYFSTTAHWKVTGEGRKAQLRVTKARKGDDLGLIEIRLDRPMQGKLSSCSIVREVDEWYAVFPAEIEVPDPKPEPRPSVGIDRGVAKLMVDSAGGMVENPHFYDRMREKLARAQREADHKKKGSNNRHKALMKVAKIQQKIARQRKHLLHEQSRHYVDTFGTIGIEKLAIKNMSKSASGTKKKPGKKVRQKSGLNRSILDAGWGMFGDMLKYKAIETGAKVIEVPAAYTSQMCSKCGHIDEKNRPSQAVFACQKCGHAENADLNAARNIEARALAAAVEPAPIKKRVSVKLKGKKKKVAVVEETQIPSV
jgi:putative transposase